MINSNLDSDWSVLDPTLELTQIFSEENCFIDCLYLVFASKEIMIIWAISNKEK
jgi:hypothetical protein